MCGKKPTHSHKNGIDRVINTVGYTSENSKSCCGNCNYIKRDNKYDDFIHKCMLIYQKHKPMSEVIQQPNVIEEPRVIVQGNKLTVEQKRERERIRKQAQREALRKRYGDEEYKKVHALKIAEQRKKE